MEDETQSEIAEVSKPVKKDYFLSASVLISTIILAGAWVYTTGLKYQQNHPQVQSQSQKQVSGNALQEEVIPSHGVTLSVQWNDLGKQMVEAGVINESQFTALYAAQGGLSPDMKALLDLSGNGNLVITPQNSGIILNLLWALGLSNKNPILENGPMENPQYGGAANFASTGGWTLSQGNAMNHYSAHQFVNLMPDEQTLVETVVKNIYRPCCGNSAYFPDCNHGMAMLGLLELMASQGATADQMYKAALTVNSYWFPDTYATIAEYLQSKGIAWNSVNPKDILSSMYSSAQGYQQIVAQMQPTQTKSSGSCGL